MVEDKGIGSSCGAGKEIYITIQHENQENTNERTGRHAREVRAEIANDIAKKEVAHNLKELWVAERNGSKKA